MRLNWSKDANKGFLRVRKVGDLRLPCFIGHVLNNGTYDIMK